MALLPKVEMNAGRIPIGSKPDHPKSWAIVLDGHSWYVPVAWTSKARAQAELDSMLKYYLPDSEWRKRLTVCPVGVQKISYSKRIDKT